MTNEQTRFAPTLYLENVAMGIEFYTAAFRAVELRRWSNPDGSVHVAEMAIDNTLFHMHQENERNKELSTGTLNGTSVVIGLFVPEPDQLMAKAVAAGAKATSPMQDYEYGYRQGTVTDPFGHRWTLQKKIPAA